MSNSLSTDQLFNDLSDKLALQWVGSREGGSRLIDSNASELVNQGQVGPLNCIHPNRIQIIGNTEQNYLIQLSDTAFKESLDTMAQGEPATIIMADNLLPLTALTEITKQHQIPLMTSVKTDSKLHSNIQYYLTSKLAEKDTVHGVFLEVLGMGVLLSGTSSIGKSELALELISRGHRLIADDAPELSQIAPDILSGSCPPLLKEFLEVRGLGILNIRAMFGENAIKNEKYLRLIIHLQQFDDQQIANIDRLTGSHSYREILGVDIPQVTIPVAPGRNMAILVETAVRNHSLRLKNYHADIDFIERQRKAIEADS